MKKTIFKIKNILKTGLVLGTAGGLLSIALISLTHNGSYVMCLPSLLCMIISIYSIWWINSDTKYYSLFSTAIYTAAITLLVSYLFLTLICTLSPTLTFTYLFRLGELLLAGIVCAAFFALKIKSKY